MRKALVASGGALVLSGSAGAIPVDLAVRIWEVDSVVDHESLAIQGENDLYARVKVGDFDFQRSRTIENDNSPNPTDWRFLERLEVQNASDFNVPITIEIWEDDFLIPDTQLDFSVDGYEIDLNYNIQTGQISGDVTSGFSAGDDGSLRFEIFRSLPRQYSTDVEFTTSSQSMWGPGEAAVLESWDEFLGPQWDVSGNAGGIATTTLIPSGCLPWWLGGGCWGAVEASLGAKIRGSTSGEVGIDLHADWDTGSVDVVYPVGIKLVYPDLRTVNAGEEFIISSSYVVLPGAKLTTNSPDAHFTATAVFDVFADIGGEVCIAGCLGGDFTLIDVRKELELLDIDTNSSFRYTLPAGTGSISASIPHVSTTGALVGTNLESSGSDKFLDLDIDLDRIVTNAFLLPPLGDSFDALGTTFSYNIIDVRAGVDLELSQQFAFMPDVRVSLDLPNSTPTFSVGESIRLTMPKGEFDVTPTFFLDADFLNETVLNLIPNFSYSGLAASAAGYGFGPLFGDTLSTTIPFVLFEDDFKIGGFQQVSTAAFRMQSAPVTGTLWLVGMGVVGLSAVRQRRRIRVA